MEIIAQRGHGKGGQAQNKISTAIRARHVPTGISVFINGRSQQANRTRAIEILTSRVRSGHSDAASSQWAAAKSQQFQEQTKIRTYNFIDNRATDHRTGKKVHNVEGVLRGKLALLD